MNIVSVTISNCTVLTVLVMVWDDMPPWWNEVRWMTQVLWFNVRLLLTDKSGGGSSASGMWLTLSNWNHRKRNCGLGETTVSWILSSVYCFDNFPGSAFLLTLSWELGWEWLFKSLNSFFLYEFCVAGFALVSLSNPTCSQFLICLGIFWNLFGNFLILLWMYSICYLEPDFGFESLLMLSF